MTKKRYEKRKIMVLVGLLLMIIMSFANPCVVSHAYVPGAGVESDVGDTGITEVDEAMGRGDDFGEGVIKYIGRWVAIIALIFFVVSFPSHQSEMRVIAFFGFVIGLGIYFGPEIVDGLLGITKK